MTARRRVSLVLCSMMLGAMAAVAPARAGLRPRVPATCDGTWQLVPGANAGPSNYLQAVSADSATDAWAVGAHQDPSGYDHTLVEHWDGVVWTVVPSPDPGSLFNYLADVVALSPSDVWAVGVRAVPGLSRTLVEHWDGTSWSIVPSINVGDDENDLYGVAATAVDDVWAVGQQFSTRGSLLLEHWDGVGWTRTPAAHRPNSSHALQSVAGTASDDVWAVGTTTTIGGGPTRTLAEHWDGAAWGIVPTVNPEEKHANVLSDVAAFSSTDVWSVGSYEVSITSNQTLAEHWDGSTWTRVTSADTTANDFLLSVSGSSGSDVWAVGDAFVGASQTLIEHWDGTSWTIYASPTPYPWGSYLEGVSARASNDVWAVGYGDSGPGALGAIIEHFC